MLISGTLKCTLMARALERISSNGTSTFVVLSDSMSFISMPAIGVESISLDEPASGVPIMPCATRLVSG